MSGGGIYCMQGSDPEISHCIISANKSLRFLLSGRGGGIYGDHRISETTRNGTIVNNTALGGGEGPSTGGEIDCDRQLMLTNCILWGNTAESCRNPFFRRSSEPSVNAPSVRTRCGLRSSRACEGRVSGESCPAPTCVAAPARARCCRA